MSGAKKVKRTKASTENELHIAALERAICGLKYGLVAISNGPESREAKRFRKANPSAPKDLEFVTGILTEVMSPSQGSKKRSPKNHR